MERTKLALKRDPTVPIGQTAPVFLDCPAPCGARIPVSLASDDPVTCGACGARYTADGWRL